MVGIALLGAGIFAKEAHLPALIEHKANLLAAYSRSTKSATSVLSTATALGSTSPIDIYSDEEPTNTLSALLQRPDITAVIVALPILIQPTVVRQCLAAGKHVLCEKPIAKDVQTATQLITDYEKDFLPKGTILSIAEQFRFDLAFTRAKELVSTRVGKLSHVHARVWGNIILSEENRYFETEWRKTPEYQGGFVLDGGVHFVALMRFVSGQEIVKTASLVEQVYGHLPPLDTVNAAVRFGGGGAGSLSISFASGKKAFEFVFVGQEGVVTVTGADGGSRVVLESGGEVLVDEVIDGKGVSEEVRAFLKAAEEGRADERAAPREALADLAVIESVCSGGGSL